MWTRVPAPQPIRPPSWLMLALEGRAWFELASVVPALPLLSRAPRGDGHPVLVLPGYLASDRSTQALRWFLRGRGYHVHGWRLGRNLGPAPEVVDGLRERFAALVARHGRTVSLVGWSLGGIYAREIARRAPEHVRSVITLASPFRGVGVSNVGRLARHGDFPPSPELRARLAAPLPVPSTALYSRTDGIVAWQSCIQDDGARSENVEVWSSHCGMGHHPAALWVIADRLAQPEGAWAQFRWPAWAAPWSPAQRAVG
jgi:pimeloyl-ACP methyl ester carboxylesterase